MLRPCCGHADCNPAEAHLKAHCGVQADGQSHSSPPASEFPLLRSLFDVDLVLSRDAKAAKRRAAAAAAATRKVLVGGHAAAEPLCREEYRRSAVPTMEILPYLLASWEARCCRHTVCVTPQCLKMSFIRLCQSSGMHRCASTCGRSEPRGQGSWALPWTDSCCRLTRYCWGLLRFRHLRSRHCH